MRWKDGTLCCLMQFLNRSTNILLLCVNLITLILKQIWTKKRVKYVTQTLRYTTSDHFHIAVKMVRHETAPLNRKQKKRLTNAVLLLSCNSSEAESQAVWDVSKTAHCKLSHSSAMQQIIDLCF